MIIYRIVSILVNTISFLLGINLLLSIPVILSQPLFAIVFFMMLCVVLYAWYANIFLKKVLLKKEKVTKRTKDMINANAIVSLILSVVILIPGVMLLANQKPFFDAMKEMMPDASITPQMASMQIWFLIIFFSLLVVHIGWTYMLMRKHKEYFEA